MKPNERKLYTKNLDNWSAIRVALAYRAITKKSSIRSIRWVKRHWEEFHEFQLIRETYGVHHVFHIKPKYARKEFLCQGFVPISEFNMRTNSGKYAYIISNELLPGEKLIYPEHFVHGRCKGYRNIYEYGLRYYGVYGYTRVYLTSCKNGIAK